MTSVDFVFEGPADANTPFTTLDAVAKSMRLLLQARHVDTSDHARRVTSMALAVLDRLDPRAAADPSVGIGYDLHDIGKATLPDAVLLKPGSLTETEWVTMRLHPEIGAQIIEAAGELRGSTAAEIIRHHHERWDGLGYPNGLAAEAIPIQCRAFAVVDAFDAMTNDRPYRRAMPMSDAMDELRRYSGTQFDAEAIDAFEDVVALWAEQPQLTHVE